MDILTKNPIQKEYYEIGKNSVHCNIKECFESFYYYSRFGVQDSLTNFLNKLICLDKMILLNFHINIFPIELKNYIYCYFLNLHQFEWMIKITNLYFEEMKNNIYKHIPNIIFEDYKNKEFFGHCIVKDCHKNEIIMFGSFCEVCGEYYCFYCDIKFLAKEFGLQVCEDCFKNENIFPKDLFL